MIAKGSGYVKGNKQAARARLVAHLKYIEHRSRDNNESRDDRRIFSKEEDVVNRQEALDTIMEHSHSLVRYHKIVLSPGEDEPVQDWREWTRKVMADLEEHRGRELTWYAVKHGNTDHQHVHVILAGAAENPETGKIQAVKMYAGQDYRYLEDRGREHSEHEWYKQLAEHVKEQEHEESPQIQTQAREEERSEHDDRGEYDR